MYKNIIIYTIVGIFVSLYFFPIGLTFIPSGINSKNICAALGLIASVMHAISNERVSINKLMLGAIGIVALYSIVGYISVDLNNTTDYSYANYFLSFAVWTFGAYFICNLIITVHGDVNIRLIGTYLAAVGFFQCISALMISEIPSFKALVDSYVSQGQEFMNEIKRWYGIGAALDSGGVRFGIILILITGLLTKDEIVRDNKTYITCLLICFFTIIILGNIISRTTSVGALLSLVYILVNGGLLRKIIPYEAIKFNTIFLALTLFTIGLAIYLYQSDDTFHKNLRFAFEGFFNWVETGEWYTDSTDKLNNEMWVWPQDQKTWIIGSGLFDNFIYSTDIGYCRHILYNGLIGFSIFSSFFLYTFVVLSNHYRKYMQIFFLLLCLGFIIWLKVATDLYQIWAMLYMLTFLEYKDQTIKFDKVIS